MVLSAWVAEQKQRVHRLITVTGTQHSSDSDQRRGGATTLTLRTRASRCFPAGGRWAGQAVPLPEKPFRRAIGNTELEVQLDQVSSPITRLVPNCMTINKCLSLWLRFPQVWNCIDTIVFQVFHELTYRRHVTRSLAHSKCPFKTRS